MEIENLLDTLKGDSISLVEFIKMTNSLDWHLIVNISIAAGALLTAYYAWKTFIQTRQERRPILSQCKDGGHFSSIIVGDGKNRQLIFEVTLKNYGINVISNYYVYGYFFPILNNSGDIQPIEKFRTSSINPVANKLTIGFSTRIKSDQWVKFVLLEVKYFDSTLNKDYYDEFFWKMGKDGNLFDVDSSEFESLKKLLNKFTLLRDKNKSN